MRTERCGRCAGCGMTFVYRPISSRPITFYNNNSVQRCTVVHQHELYGSGRVTVGSGSARCILVRCSHSSYQTHGALHGPDVLMWPRAATPLTAQPDAPCATCTSRCLLPLAPLCVHAARPGSSHGSTAWSRALSHTHAVGCPDGQAARRHAFAHCHGLRVTTGSLPPSSLESASVSVAAVTSTVAYAGAGCT